MEMFADIKARGRACDRHTRWELEAAGRDLGLDDPRVQPTGAGEGKKWRERVRKVLKCASSTGRKVGQVKRQSRDGLSTLSKCGGECGGVTITDREINEICERVAAPGGLHSEAEQVGSRDEGKKQGNEATKEGIRKGSRVFSLRMCFLRRNTHAPCRYARHS